MPSAALADVIDALPEPALLATPSGLIARANLAARRRAGRDLAAFDLIAAAGERAEQLKEFLLRCTGSKGLMQGAITLPEGNGWRKYRCSGCRIAGEQGPLIFLRCQGEAEDRFLVLNERLSALHSEVRRRRHAQAVLEESLRERELLIREIHHRVKNNVQILQSMIASAARNAEHPGARQALEDAARRLSAIAAVQQVLYTADQPTDYSARAFLEALMPALRAAAPPQVELVSQASDLRLPADVATPLALIVNELVTNAIKHGVSAGGLISVSLKDDGDAIALVVTDSGPGFEPGEIKSRASGLGLVRGLARQLGGNFVVTRDKGARCVVRFGMMADARIH